jgi:hypothetical protein
MRSLGKSLALACSAIAVLLVGALPAAAGVPVKGAFTNIQVLGDDLESVTGQMNVRPLGGSSAFVDLALISNQLPNTMLKFIGRSSVCGGSTRPVTKRFELTQAVGNDRSIFVNKSVPLTAGVIRSVSVIGPSGFIGCNATTMYEEMPAAAAARAQAVDDGIQDGAIGRLPNSANGKGRGLVVRLNSTEVQIRASLKGLTAGHDYSIRGVSKPCGQGFTSSDVTFTTQLVNVASTINKAETKSMTQRKLTGLRSMRIKDLDTNSGWGCIPLTRFQIVSS